MYFFYDAQSPVSCFSAPKHCRFDALTVLCHSGGCTLTYIIVCVHFLWHFRSTQPLLRPQTLQIWRVYSTVSLGRAHFDVYNRLCTFFTTLQVWSAALAPSNTADLVRIQYCVVREGALWCIQSFVYFFYDTPSLVSHFCALKHCRFDARTVLCRLVGCTMMYIIVCVLFLQHSMSGQPR